MRAIADLAWGLLVSVALAFGIYRFLASALWRSRAADRVPAKVLWSIAAVLGTLCLFAAAIALVAVVEVPIAATSWAETATIWMLGIGTVLAIFAGRDAARERGTTTARCDL